MMRKKDFITSFSNNLMIDLPAASNLYFLWNFGSLTALILMTQIISGIFLSFHYTNNATDAFDSIIHILRDVNMGWLFRAFHANGSSIFFFFIYMHIIRSMIYGSYTNFKTWMIGILLMAMAMGTAFLGYVLPWGQMSFWGATVITNMVSSIPYLGNFIVSWIWGGFSVDNPTLNRFFSFHFCIPFIMAMATLIHLIYLHDHGSSNPLGISSMSDKIYFHTYYSTKDYFGFVVFFFILLVLILLAPYSMMDPENFISANPLVTPEHIQPEWYFLFAYTILRSIPNKLGGVLGLILSFTVLLPYGFFMNSSTLISPNTYANSLPILTTMLFSFLVLTWIGMMPVDHPFEKIGIFATFTYFSLFPMFYSLLFSQDILMLNI
uniref:Cytochrome b n=1 Tax=Gnathostomula paradoxa TaxID=66783 RepID=A0A0F6PZQ2_9BILA|nr:cytochrome b [Gnathostomula paradoxa]AKD00033.1 cytochrome b [Gnathostomula paradoxa]